MDSDFGHFFQDATKVRIPSQIKPPVGFFIYKQNKQNLVVEVENKPEFRKVIIFFLKNHACNNCPSKALETVRWLAGYNCPPLHSDPKFRIPSGNCWKQYPILSGELQILQIKNQLYFGKGPKSYDTNCLQIFHKNTFPSKYRNSQKLHKHTVFYHVFILR